MFCTTPLHSTTTNHLTFKEPLGRSRMNIESMKAKKRVVKLITIVILIFTICWLPLQVSHTSVSAGFLSGALICTTFPRSRNSLNEIMGFSHPLREILVHFILLPFNLKYIQLFLSDSFQHLLCRLFCWGIPSKSSIFQLLK